MRRERRRLIIEIFSGSNRTHDTVVKFASYEKYGVPEYWLVDQRDPQIRVFHTGPMERIV